MFRAIMGPSSREKTVCMRHLVLVILCGSQVFRVHPVYQRNRITSNKFHKNTVISPDDGPIIARNM